MFALKIKTHLHRPDEIYVSHAHEKKVKNVNKTERAEKGALQVYGAINVSISGLILFLRHVGVSYFTRDIITCLPSSCADLSISYTNNGIIEMAFLLLQMICIRTTCTFNYSAV